MLEVGVDVHAVCVAMCAVCDDAVPGNAGFVVGMYIHLNEVEGAVVESEFFDALFGARIDGVCALSDVLFAFSVPACCRAFAFILNFASARSGGHKQDGG